MTDAPAILWSHVSDILGSRHSQDREVVLDLHLIAGAGHLPGGASASPSSGHLGHLVLPDQGGGDHRSGEEPGLDTHIHSLVYGRGLEFPEEIFKSLKYIFLQYLKRKRPEFTTSYFIYSFLFANSDSVKSCQSSLFEDHTHSYVI